MTLRRFGSMIFAVTGIEMPYISQSHCTVLPVSSFPLPLVNQNFVVTSGFTNASNTSAAGLRISIAALVTGICFSCGLVNGDHLGEKSPFVEYLDRSCFENADLNQHSGEVVDPTLVDDVIV